MDFLSPEVIQALLQMGGTPAVIGIMLYTLWNHGPQKEIRRVAEAVESIRNELRSHREEFLREQQADRLRINRLEVLSESAQRRQQ